MPMFVSNFRTVRLVFPVVGALFLAGCAQGEDLPPSMLGSGTSITSGGASGSSGIPSTGSGGSDDPGSVVPTRPAHRPVPADRMVRVEAKVGAARTGARDRTARPGRRRNRRQGWIVELGWQRWLRDRARCGNCRERNRRKQRWSCSAEGGLPSGMMLLSEDFEDGMANGWVSPHRQTGRSWTTAARSTSKAFRKETARFISPQPATWRGPTWSSRPGSSRYSAAAARRTSPGSARGSKMRTTSIAQRFAPTANSAFAPGSTATGRTSATRSTSCSTPRRCRSPTASGTRSSSRSWEPHSKQR